MISKFNRNRLFYFFSKVAKRT